MPTTVTTTYVLDAALREIRCTRQADGQLRLVATFLERQTQNGVPIATREIVKEWSTALYPAVKTALDALEAAFRATYV